MRHFDQTTIATLPGRRNNQLLRERIVLYAGANIPSRASQNAYTAALSYYPAMGPSFLKEQPDTDLVSELETALKSEITTLFKAAWAEPRLPSCTLANLAVYHAFSKPGDVMLAPASAHGGHLSQRRSGTPELAGLKVIELPFDAPRCRMDSEAAAELILAEKPRLVMLGRSVILTPDDLDPIVKSARAAGTTTVFDASHVSGLIAGGTFPNPLELGVDIVTSSTYKTLPGRPLGIVMGADEEQGKIFTAFVDRYMLANYDAGKLPSMLLTLQEFSENGAVYAERVITNTRVLATSLAEAGLPVIAPRETEIFTHQLLVPLDVSVAEREVLLHLQNHGVLAGICDDPTRTRGKAIRIGTQFVTSQGFGSRQILTVADILSRLLEPTSEGSAIPSPAHASHAAIKFLVATAIGEAMPETDIEFS